MFFPTYRQQGWLIARRWPLVDMMCQVLSNEKDSARMTDPSCTPRATRGSSISGNLGTNTSRRWTGRWRPAIKGDTCIASGVVGEGTTAEADFHHD